MPGHPSRFHATSLDAINFLLADVNGAVGPYLNVFLVTQRQWSQSAVGLVTMVGGLIALVLRTPAGALIDATPAKRGLLIAALAMVAGAAIALYAAPSFWLVLAANGLMGVAGDVFAPAVAAMTLGLVGREALARRMGRNAAFDHAGNVAIAVVAGGVGYLFSQRSVFLLVPVFGFLAVAAVLSIPSRAIDPDRARGFEPGEHTPIGYKDLLACRPLAVFAACALLFHFANAPLLVLVGQKLAMAHPDVATAMMSSCIVAAQLIMLPIAVLVGRNADRWGRKPILLVGFAILPLRAVLYPFSDATPWLLGVQLLDGIGAGVFGALTPLLIADLMRGTGRYNVALGLVGTAQGIGASASGLVAGEIVDHFGYAAAFLTLGAVACAALATLVLAMPETAPSLTRKPR